MIPEIDEYYFIINEQDGILKNIMLQCAEVNDSNEGFSYLRLQSLACELLYELMERFSVKRNQHSELPIINSEWNQMILAYINENINTLHSVRQISDHFGYSREYFSRMFKKNMGISCQEFILKYRLNMAVEMMCLTKNSPEAISKEIGFPSYRSFRENFMRIYHQTPQQFLDNKDEVTPGGSEKIDYSVFKFSQYR